MAGSATVPSISIIPPVSQTIVSGPAFAVGWGINLIIWLSCTVVEEQAFLPFTPTVIVTLPDSISIGPGKYVGELSLDEFWVEPLKVPSPEVDQK